MNEVQDMWIPAVLMLGLGVVLLVARLAWRAIRDTRFGQALEDIFTAGVPNPAYYWQRLHQWRRTRRKQR